MEHLLVMELVRKEVKLMVAAPLALAHLFYQVYLEMEDQPLKTLNRHQEDLMTLLLVEVDILVAAVDVLAVEEVHITIQHILL
jgi:hypothetical protein